MTEVEASINHMLHPPYDEGMLTHRDFFGQDWSVVFETPERLLMMWTKALGGASRVAYSGGGVHCRG